MRISNCASTVPTFAELSAKVDQGGQWRGRTRETRQRTLARYAARLMGRPVDQIDRAAVLSVLGPVYRDKPATGKLLRGWIRGVLAAAQALGHVDVNTAGEVIDAALRRSGRGRPGTWRRWPLPTWWAGLWSGATRAAICSTSGAG